MAACSKVFFISFLAFVSLLSVARSDDTTDQLFKGINSYRASINLSSLTDNQNAACLAGQLAKQFESQPCSNTTGADTVPGTEEQFPNYPDFLSYCHLNVTVTQDAAIMPACIPGLSPAALVLSNFTNSQYSQSLNESSYVGIGIADAGNWIVVVLSTNTPTGDFSPASSPSAAADGVIKFATDTRLVLLLLIFLMIWMV